MTSLFTEEWKPVVGYEELFLVSNYGRVWSLRTDKELCQGRSNGYPVISTKIGGRCGVSKLLRVHKMVAEAFIGSPPSYIINECKEANIGYIPINHIDGNKENNFFGNLEWTTPKRNTNHAISIGLCDEAHKKFTGKGALSKDQIRIIKNHYKPRCKKFGARALARKFGVNHSSVSKMAKALRQL